MISALKSAAQSVADSIQGLASAGLDKLKASVNAFAAASPELEEIGYRVSAIELCCALSPCIAVFLDRQKMPSDEGFEGLLARHAHNVTLRTVVGLLRQTEKIIAKFDLEKQRCTSLVLELGVPPRIRLMYTDKEKQALQLEPPPMLNLLPWKHLGQKPGSVYRQLFVKGRNIAARTLYGAYMSEEEPRTVEQIAEDWQLPLEIVQEAISYCQSDPPEIREDWEREEANIQARMARDPQFRQANNFDGDGQRQRDA